MICGATDNQVYTNDRKMYVNVDLCRRYATMIDETGKEVKIAGPLGGQDNYR